MDLKLKLELLPEATWKHNLRLRLTPYKWQKLSKYINSENNYTCEICGAVKSEHFKKFDCHEVWKFDENEKTQKLVRLQTLCFLCHNVKHFGYAGSQDWIDKDTLIQHFLLINQVSREIFDQHLSESEKQWNYRNSIVWDIQFQEILEKYKNITILKREEREIHLKMIVNHIINNPKDTNLDIIKKFSNITGIKKITHDAFYILLVEKKY
ncbi:hypothetical protein M5X11_16090 [Paenibacillus alginolyticus]|uniref:hypothetical protein n=1 Tax=Paenibacillus alginolyticus TaxID=59839 RepID=UPI000426AAD7|nr:hypothetical protein [Paenibacillus alginolyticus]MCY9666465.1 hypothetical protein [Paenibacillus alginolyticus]